MVCKRKHIQFSFPIWSLCIYKNYVLITGGGGGKKFGLENKLNIYKSGSMELVKEHSTGDQLASSLNYIPSKDLILAAYGKGISAFKINEKNDFVKLFYTESEKEKGSGTVRPFDQDTKIVSGGEEGVIKVWKFDSETSITKLVEIVVGIEVSCVDAKGKFVCAALKNKSCAIYSAETGCKLKSLMFSEKPSVPMMFKSCSFTNKSLLTLQTGPKMASYLTKWKITNDMQVIPEDSIQVSNTSATYLKVSKSGKLAGIGSSDGKIIVVKTDELEIVMSKMEFHMPATSLDFNSNESAMIIGAADYSCAYIKITSNFWNALYFVLSAIVISYFIIKT
ncbi:hypothetical protein SteCoe_14678 [Stentor coeruleus]|uniref:Anaphase-promoting complex subunit 4 WD40 domain-containing protein n=1 Tax=Stentor coeruleus TaxID=5963 RepID=A0A1R2C5H4_9CILI|nr:hypothetical protein SteCoe_14678 [Stentor coeruleus]